MTPLAVLGCCLTVTSPQPRANLPLGFAQRRGLHMPVCQQDTAQKRKRMLAQGQSGCVVVADDVFGFGRRVKRWRLVIDLFVRQDVPVGRCYDRLPKRFRAIDGERLQRVRARQYLEVAPVGLRAARQLTHARESLRGSRILDATPLLRPASL